MATTKQIAALKYLVFNVRTDNNLSKQIVAFLLDKSEGLTKSVSITLWQDREGYTKEEVKNTFLALMGMMSGNYTTHLHELLAVAGNDFDFDLHYGHVDASGAFNNKGQFPGSPNHKDHSPDDPLRYTFWLRRKGDSCAAITVSREELEKIDLKKPGLYDLE